MRAVPPLVVNEYLPARRSGVVFAFASFAAPARNQYGMRRFSAPRVRTTYPVASASGAFVVVTVTGSGPGTVTVGGTETTAEAGPDWGVSETAQEPAPPPASVRSTCCVWVAVGPTKPNESATGEAKTCGL